MEQRNLEKLSAIFAVGLALSVSSCFKQEPAGDTLNLSGTHNGNYIYGEGSSEGGGSTVETKVEVTQSPGSEVFTGVMEEPYTNFGTAKDGKLWADIKGTVEATREGGVAVEFIKTYRHFTQESVTYQGTIEGDSDQLKGSWRFSSNPSQSGTFSWTISR